MARGGRRESEHEWPKDTRVEAARKRRRWRITNPLRACRHPCEFLSVNVPIFAMRSAYGVGLDERAREGMSVRAPVGVLALRRAAWRRLRALLLATPREGEDADEAAAEPREVSRRERRGGGPTRRCTARGGRRYCVPNALLLGTH